jgi:transglutaminase-like putative cysteine protease
MSLRRHVTPSARRFIALPLALAAAASVDAQAPRITPQGDPSVKSDTIYRLAVKAEEHPEEASAFLLDDGVMRVEADGRSRKTYRQIVQVLKQEAVDNLQEHSFSYEPGHQKLTVNWIRVVKPSGEIISAKPTMKQESQVPAEMGDPVYSDTKVIRASLSGVAVGTIVDYSYTIEELKPARKGDFYTWWGVSTGLSVRRSRLIIDMPKSMEPLILEKNLNFARQEKVAGDRRMYVWATNDLPRIKPEPYAADSNGVYMSVGVAAPATWHDIGAWYAGLARGRYSLGATAESKLRSVIAKAKSRDDTIRAVHRWVAQDIRYVSIDLGVGGYQPRTPDTVVATGFGDCKDKATLFVASLNALGITAYPVLLASGGGVERALPSKDQFNHAIAAVATDHGYRFADLTVDMMPFGQLPYSEQGEFGLLVHPDGQTEEVTFPLDPVTANYSRDVITGTLDADGTLDLRYDETAGGTRAPMLRRLFENPMDSATQAKFTRALAGQMYTGATGVSVVGFPGKDLEAQPRMQIHLRKEQALTHSAGTEILTLPISSPAAMVNVANQIEALPERRFPIDASRVIGPISGGAEMRITLPAGWKVRLPKSVKAEGPFGSYTSEYTQVGKELRIVRTMSGAKGIYPPERIKDVVAWLRAVGSDDASFFVIDRPSASESGTTH